MIRIVFTYFVLIAFNSFAQRGHHLKICGESFIRLDKFINTTYELQYLNSGNKFDFSIGFGGRNLYRKTPASESITNGVGLSLNGYYRIKKWEKVSWGLINRNRFFRNYFAYSYSINSSGAESVYLKLKKGISWKSHYSQYLFGAQFEYLPLSFFSINSYIGLVVEHSVLFSTINYSYTNTYGAFGLNLSFILPRKK